MDHIDCWSALSALQRSLKKEFLLVEKEQQEKVKLKREIEELVRSYHRHLIELHHPGAELLKEEGFDNCYNFIKDVIVTLSTNHHLGRLILSICQESSSLPALVIYGLYENVETNDPYAKQITKLIHGLMWDLGEGSLSPVEKERVTEAWRLYMGKVDREAYFQHIADSTLKKLLRQEYAMGGLSKIAGSETRKGKQPLELIDKEQLMAEFLDQIESEADLCLHSIKIPLQALVRGRIGESKDRVWRLVSYFYLRPFLKIANNGELPREAKERVLQFVDELVAKWGFTGELSSRSLDPRASPRSEEGELQIERVVGKLTEVNEQRLSDLLGESCREGHKIQITILGSCLNFVQLQELFILIHSHREAFSGLSERVVTRTLKIFEIAPKLQVLHRERPAVLFVSLSELRYEESISSDYYANYTVVYRGSTLQQMLKQVLVEMENLSDLRASHKNTLALIFGGLAAQTDHNGVGISPQLQMKIKYLVYLLGQPQTRPEAQLMCEMLDDLLARDCDNFKLFEDTKFSLLKVYCNLRNLKSQLRLQREAESKVENRIRLIRKLEAVKLDLCLTSKATRNQSQIEDHLDKYRYRLSSADDILIQPTSECIHKENTFTGRDSHPHHIGHFLQAFAALEEVRYYIRHPSFASSDHSRYPYCSEGKIGDALAQFVATLVETLKLTPNEKTILESVIFRSLHELLLGGGREAPLDTPRKGLLADRQSPRKVEGESPRKRGSSSQQKRSGSSYSLEEGVALSGPELSPHEEQLHVMGQRYVQGLMEAWTPQEKMRGLRDVVEVYKIALGRGGRGQAEKKVGEEVIARLLVKTVAAARVPNLASQLSFLEMFLPEEKLMSGDGKVLKQFERALVKAGPVRPSGRGRVEAVTVEY